MIDDRIRRAARRHRALGYGIAVACVAMALLTRSAAGGILHERQVFPAFILAVATTAWLAGLGPALFALGLGYVVTDWFFIGPPRTLSILHPTGQQALGAAFFFLVGTVVALLTESMHGAEGRARKAAKVAQRSEAELAASREEIRALVAHLQSVREEERTRIARELHDDLGQSLTGLRLGLSWLQGRLLQTESPRVRPLLERTRAMSALVDETVERVRRTAAELRPGILDDFGLEAAIAWHAAEFQKRTGIRCEVIADPDAPGPDRDVSTALFRIVQEALTNVARHAGARSVRIALEREEGRLAVEVVDDGRGITPDEESSHGSFGLLGMRERARLLGGEVTIGGAPGRGTTVRARVPI